MATNVAKASLTIDFDWKYQNVLDQRNVNDANKQTYLKAFTDGDDVDKAEVVFHDEYSLTASGTQALDLGALVDAFGNTITFEKVKMIIVRNMSTTAGDLVKLGPGTNAHTQILGGTAPFINIPPGGCFAWCDPSDDATNITPSTDDDLLLTELGGASTVLVRVTIVGTKA